MYNLSFMRERRRAGVGLVITGFVSCSSGRVVEKFFRQTKGELSRSTKVCTFITFVLAGQGGTVTIEGSLWRDPTVSRLRDTDSRLDTSEAVDEIRSISDMDPQDGAVVKVVEFRIVSEAEELTELPAISERLEKLVIESRVPGEAEKKDDRDELDMLLKRVVLSMTRRTRVWW